MALITEDDLLEYFHCQREVILNSMDIVSSFNLDSLGLFNLRDKDKSCFRVFIELVKTAKKGIPLSSDELAYRLDLSRGTVVHHINKLIESGIVVQANKGYILRVDNLRALIDEVEKDLRRTCDDLRSMAKEIDESLGL